MNHPMRNLQSGHLSRYEEHKNQIIPAEQRLAIRFRGHEREKVRILRGKYAFIFDEAYLNIYDPHGFGIVEMIERGEIASVDISACDGWGNV